MSSDLLNETEVAKKLRVTLACLRRWRLEKRGPAFIKIGQLVRYRHRTLMLGFSLCLPAAWDQQEKKLRVRLAIRAAEPRI